MEMAEEGDAGVGDDVVRGEGRREVEDESLMDLISGFGMQKEAQAGTGEDERPGGGVREEKRRSGKGKGGEK